MVSEGKIPKIIVETIKAKIPFKVKHHDGKTDDSNL
jgi:hypothetical protein